jgi:hypothetical protein
LEQPVIPVVYAKSSLNVLLSDYKYLTLANLYKRQHAKTVANFAAIDVDNLAGFLIK